MSATAEPWSGAVQLGRGWALFRGRAGDNRPHAHHALQLTLGAAAVERDDQTIVTAPGLLIPSNLRHRLRPTSAALSLLYLDPDTVAGRGLNRQADGAPLPLDAAWVADLLAQLALPAPDPAGWLARQLHLETPGAGPDPLMARLIHGLDEELADPLPAAVLARRVGLSSSRFQHRFRQHTGLPLRAWLRWQRLTRALEQVLGGRTVTEAAHAAGFADAAHLTRSCRRHFGLPPSALGALRSA